MEHVRNALQIAPWLALTIFVGWYSQAPPRKEEDENRSEDEMMRERRMMMGEDSEISMGGIGAGSSNLTGSNVNVKDKRSLERFLAEADSKANQAKDQGEIFI